MDLTLSIIAVAFAFDPKKKNKERKTRLHKYILYNIMVHFKVEI